MQGITTGHEGQVSLESKREPQALAFCGWSGAGKTTLLEALIPRLTARDLTVAVVKHDAHGVRLDTPGKDSDRLFRAGADVCLHGPNEGAWRFHASGEASLEATLQNLDACHDVVLVEGHKDTPLPKIWLEHKERSLAAPGISNVVAALPWNSHRVGEAEEYVIRHLDLVLRRRRVFGGILVGGRSRRMGYPKQMIEIEGQTMVERISASLEPLTDEVVLLGGGPVPKPLAGCTRLPDVYDSDGPMAGILAALRWAPDAAWIIASCDLPRITAEATRWLAGERRPGRWAVMPRTAAGFEPLLAVYEPQARLPLEALASAGRGAPWRISQHPKVHTTEPPAEIVDSWVNANTPADLEAISRGG